MNTISFHGHMRPVTGMKFNADGDLIATCGLDGKISLIRSKDGVRLGSFGETIGHKAVMDLSMNYASTMLAVGGMDFKTSIFDLKNGNPLLTWEHRSPCRCVGFSHDDRMLFTITDAKMGEKSSLKLWPLPSKLGTTTDFEWQNKPRGVFSTPESMLYAAYGPTNDTIYVGSEDGSVAIIDTETLQEIQCYTPHNDEVRKIKFDQEYFTLITASKDKTAKLLDARTLKTIATYQSEQPVNDAAIAPRADHILLGGGTEASKVTTTDDGGSKFALKFFHKVTEECLGLLQCHFGTINCVAFHPKNKGFASGAVDGFVKIHHFDQSYSKAPGFVPSWPYRVDDDLSDDDDEDEDEDDDEVNDEEGGVAEEDAEEEDAEEEYAEEDADDEEEVDVDNI